MTRKEMKSIMKNKQMKIMLKRNAKALYLLSDLSEAYTYLQAKIDIHMITEDEADQILEEISTECTYMTVGEINKLKKMI